MSKIMNKALIDPALGDLFFYNFFKKKWEGIYNAGFHDLHRHDKMNGLAMEFEKNFKMHYKHANFDNSIKNNALYEQLKFKESKKSHFIKIGIIKGKSAFFNQRSNKYKKMHAISMPYQHIQQTQKV